MATKLILADISQYTLTTAGFGYIDKRTISLILLTNKSLDEVINDFSNKSKTSKMSILLNDSVQGPMYENFTELNNEYTVKKNVKGYVNKINIILRKPETVVNNAELEEAIAYTVSNIPDQQALKCVSIFPTWESYINKPMSEGTRTQYNGKLVKSRQDIPVVLENQPPGIETAALYETINQENAGTLEDPIPYDQTMTVHSGKYYIENGIIYKCIRDSGQPLYASCASLVGNYFSVAE